MGGRVRSGVAGTEMRKRAQSKTGKQKHQLSLSAPSAGADCSRATSLRALQHMGLGIRASGTEKMGDQAHRRTGWQNGQASQALCALCASARMQNCPAPQPHMGDKCGSRAGKRNRRWAFECGQGRCSVAVSSCTCRTCRSLSSLVPTTFIDREELCAADLTIRKASTCSPPTAPLADHGLCGCWGRC